MGELRLLRRGAQATRWQSGIKRKVTCQQSFSKTKPFVSPSIAPPARWWASPRSQTGWEILNRPHLGLSFRLLVPLTSDDPVDVAFAERMGRAHGERRNNPVYGEKQTLTSLELAPDGKAATFTWDGVTSEVGGPLPIKITLTVTLTERQAIFAMTVENRSRACGRERLLPLPGRRPASGRCGLVQDLLLRLRHGARVAALADLRRTCAATYGVDYPTQLSHSSHAHRRADDAVHPAARREARAVRRRLSRPAPSWSPGTPSCAPATAARSIIACRKGRRSAARTWPPASPRSTCPTSSRARRAR